MIKVRRSLSEELDLFHEMEQQAHARNFINGATLHKHRTDFADSSIHYLSIEKAKHAMVGYFILALDTNTQVVEFRRILIDADHRGIGQQAIRLMERFCVDRLCAKRIWLDVYSDNVIAQHVYEKLGYVRFREETVGSRSLYYYEKSLESSRQ